jgi:hypothetical protein
MKNIKKVEEIFDYASLTQYILIVFSNYLKNDPYLSQSNRVKNNLL